MHAFSFFFANTDSKDKVKMVLLFALLTVSAVFDALGVASIFPFLTIVSDPNQMLENVVISKIYTVFNFKNTDQFFAFMAAIFIFLFVTSLVVKTIAQFFLLKFLFLKEHYLAQRIFSDYLGQNYLSYTSTNSSDATKTILSEVNQIMVYAFTPIANIISASITAVAILALLFFVEPVVATVAVLLFAGLYIAMSLFFKKTIKRLGGQRTSANAERYKVVTESLNGFKELKMMNMEEEAVRRFSVPSREFAESQANVSIIGTLPRYFVEAISMSLLIIFSLYSMRLNGDFHTGLPLIGLFALASYRLMPLIQQIYNSYSNLNFAKTLIKDLISQLSLFSTSISENNDTKNIKFQQSIKIINGSFNYPGGRKPQITNVECEIDKGSFVAFVGETGSGKTTIVDLLVGLLPFDSGKILIDGAPLDQLEIKSWYKKIAYVSQSTFLSDDTILSNIAFYMDPKNVNFDDVVRAAKFAKIHDFIENNLPQKYNTRVGDKGIALSGGQKQRLGIARAVFSNSDILVLDEATSALDQKTEQSILDNFQTLKKNKTIIVISHRLQALKKCDKLFLVREGEIMGEGSYDELLNESKYFSQMAHL